MATALQQRGDDSEAEAMYRRARDLAPPQSTLAGEVERSLEELNPEGSGSGREDGPKPAVGRNDPCPCGSGKKYKHCCLKTDLQQQGGAGGKGAKSQRQQKKARAKKRRR
jgi:hypothetical protein